MAERCIVNLVFLVIIFVLFMRLYNNWKQDVDEMAQRALDEFRAERDREKWLEEHHKKHDDDNS